MQNNHTTKIFYLDNSICWKLYVKYTLNENLIYIHIIDIDNNAYIDMAQASSYDSELYAYKVNCKLLYKIIISFSNLTHTLYLRTIYTTFTINAEHLALPQILGGATILWTKLILELLHN